MFFLESIITAIQLLALLVLCIASPIIAFLKLKWRLAAVESELANQCQQLQMLEQELALYRQAVLKAQPVTVKHEPPVASASVSVPTSKLVALAQPTRPFAERDIHSKSSQHSSGQLKTSDDKPL